ncbi:TonB-dependent siderophore receptor [Xanthomonas translucens]|uniref:TonB-dependent siderophore receptor n=1 Tax=Xanthomonas campestris pv. translucens TaxID=343 RepID=UPI00071E7DDA|nr:TonB-dependent receptor [Xanthomonas translucens]UKE57641.1 TonB-dependent receptor [Xanthomonas translucens pv. hordei]MCT8275338.1 TonB-dependent receptor [Xanthomonas translucens pv. translucens]MCT8308052.1 TonB-dependent receptor [Xanthomonas translucens pv. translucens]MQS40481.1 TonB-dependent receptor [Xanthomonas translucens pv. translucens]QSQ38172.1 TonB-dependent receptor [Xanthomonas translucens pv. translucens]
MPLPLPHPLSLFCMALLAGLCAGPADADPVLRGTDPAADPAPAELDAVQVVGRRDSGTYQADAIEGSKTGLNLRQLPQSVRVLPRQAIDDLGATRLDATLDYVGGISRQNGFGGLWDNFAVRGLPGNENTGSATLLNGLAANRGYNAPRDTANIEAIEFLKGPAAALYGSSEPGGTLNIVTKRPQWRPAAALEASAGSHDAYRVAADSTGPLLGESLAYRLNVALEDKHSFRDFVHSRRRFVAPALTWRLGEATTLRYDGEWLRQQVPLDRGIVAVRGDLGAIPRSRFLGEPGDGDVLVDNRNHQLLLQHDIADDWSALLAASRRDGSLSGYSTEPSVLRNDGRSLWRQRRWRDFASHDTALQAELRGQVDTGAWRHGVLLGAEAYDFVLTQRMRRIRPSAAAPYALDVFAPVYGQPLPTPLPFVDTRERQRNAALYLQDAIALTPQWTLLLGLRHDRYRQALDDRRSGGHYAQAPTKTTPRIGLSYAPGEQWSWYFNAGRTFRPNTGSDVWNGTGTAHAPAPESGRALELGGKWQARDGRLGGTVALYEIVKDNVLTGDPNNPGNQIAAGRVRSRGAEADLSGQLSEHWRLNASASWNRVQVLRDNTLQLGGSLINVPKFNASLLAVRETALPGGGLLGFGGGMTYSGQRLAEAYTQAQADAGIAPAQLPGYGVARLLAYWRIDERLRVSLDVDNVFDRRYYTSSVAATPWVAVGAARSVTAGVQYRF